VLGGDLRFSGVVNFNLPPNIEDLIRAVPKDDLLEGDIEMMCHGLILARHGAAARGRSLPIGARAPGGFGQREASYDRQHNL